MDDAGALAYLEGALAEVFGSVPTPPARMQHLERELSGYRAEPGAWRQCARFVKMTDNPEVHWFAHSVFEHTVACGWDGVDAAEKAELREFVYMCIKEQDKSTPTHVANKMYKVYADLGKRDWPADFPNFFQLILEMLGGDREELLVGLQVTQLNPLYHLPVDTHALARTHVHAYPYAHPFPHFFRTYTLYILLGPFYVGIHVNPAHAVG
jgi:hypothetical protein